MADVIANFAAALVEDDEIDHCEVVEMLDGVLEYGAYLRLCDHLEVCNIHHCDIQICVDEQDDDCAAGQASLKANGSRTWHGEW